MKIFTTGIIISAAQVQPSVFSIVQSTRSCLTLVSRQRNGYARAQGFGIAWLLGGGRNAAREVVQVFEGASRRLV